MLRGCSKRCNFWWGNTSLSCFWHSYEFGWLTNLCFEIGLSWLTRLKKMGSGSWHIEKRSSLRNDSFSREFDNILENGSLSIIVLGASGDLAKKKTFPALFNLFRQVYSDSFLLYLKKNREKKKTSSLYLICGWKVSFFLYYNISLNW